VSASTSDSTIVSTPVVSYTAGNNYAALNIVPAGALGTATVTVTVDNGAPRELPASDVFSFPLASDLSSGKHILSIQARDAYGTWGNPVSLPVISVGGSSAVTFLRLVADKGSTAAAGAYAPGMSFSVDSGSWLEGGLVAPNPPARISYAVAGGAERKLDLEKGSSLFLPDLSFFAGFDTLSPNSGGSMSDSWSWDVSLGLAAKVDFFDGGGLDIACLGFAEVDRYGNVNASRVGDTVFGAGGFINISQSAGRVVFCGTLTAGGLVVRVGGGRIAIEREGRHRKFVDSVQHMTFSAAQARARGQRVTYVTERAVFELGDDGPVLVEIAAGLDVERDVLAHMAFRPAVAQPLRTMDAALFPDDPTGSAGAKREPAPATAERRP